MRIGEIEWVFFKCDAGVWDLLIRGWMYVCVSRQTQKSETGGLPELKNLIRSKNKKSFCLIKLKRIRFLFF